MMINVCDAALCNTDAAALNVRCTHVGSCVSQAFHMSSKHKLETLSAPSASWCTAKPLKLILTQLPTRTLHAGS